MVNIRQFWNKKEIPIILAVLVLIVLGGWYAWHWHQNRQAAPPPGWAEYQSQKYGLRFIYPKSWGQPQVREIPHQQGKEYDFYFPPSANKSKPVVSFRLESADMQDKNCNPATHKDCSTSHGVTKKDLLAALKRNKSLDVKYDSNSLAAILPGTGSSTISLIINQIVDLVKIKVSVAAGAYAKYNADKNCPIQHLAPNTTPNCITMSDYNDLNLAMKSFKSI